mmetsp:Transcript_33378/g.83222  ORF Transcript_33378/g.83222 Transcript_33378/m.83222 type:complete len:271 (-) Transcript_33378:903-1715(-)
MPAQASPLLLLSRTLGQPQQNRGSLSLSSARGRAGSSTGARPLALPLGTSSTRLAQRTTYRLGVRPSSPPPPVAPSVRPARVRPTPRLSPGEIGKRVRATAGISRRALGMWQSSPSLGLRRAPRRRRSRAPKFAPRPSPSLSPSRTDVLRVTSATRRRSARARYRRRSLTTRRRRLKLVTTTAVATMTTRGARLAQARVLAPASRLARQELRRSRTQRALRCGQFRRLGAGGWCAPPRSSARASSQPTTAAVRMPPRRRRALLSSSRCAA